MQFIGVVAYRLPIDRPLQARYDHESNGMLRDNVHCRDNPAHIYRLLYPPGLDQITSETVRIALDLKMGKCGSHPSRIDDF